MRQGRSGWLAAAAWGVALAAAGQVELSWTLAHNRTLLMEPIRATVTLANYTGQDLDLTPRGNARLRFDVEDQPTSLVPSTGEPLVRQAVIIPDGETREVEVDLLDAYRIVKGQSYMLTPRFEVDGVRFLGERLSLEVQPGLELLRRDYGMPGSGQARTVSLRLIHRDRADRVFFRIDHATSGYCLGMYDLGRVVRYYAPRIELDREGVFHVLHQTGPDRFVHTSVDYDGGKRGMTFYVAEVGSIRFVRDDDGAVQVAGGTPFEEDPDEPGMLSAPALPPSTPYGLTGGEPLPVARPQAPARDRPAVLKTRNPADEAVVW